MRIVDSFKSLFGVNKGIQAEQAGHVEGTSGGRVVSLAETPGTGAASKLDKPGRSFSLIGAFKKIRGRVEVLRKQNTCEGVAEALRAYVKSGTTENNGIVKKVFSEDGEPRLNDLTKKQKEVLEQALKQVVNGDSGSSLEDLANALGERKTIVESLKSYFLRQQSKVRKERQKDISSIISDDKKREQKSLDAARAMIARRIDICKKNFEDLKKKLNSPNGQKPEELERDKWRYENCEKRLEDLKKELERLDKQVPEDLKKESEDLKNKLEDSMKRQLEDLEKRQSKFLNLFAEEGKYDGININTLDDAVDVFNKKAGSKRTIY